MPKRINQRKPIYQKRIALDRIKILFKKADKAKDIKLANRYVELARKIAMKYKVKIPKELKRKFCKHCYSYFKPNKTCRVRLDNKKIVYYCFHCKKYTRITYKD